MPSGKPADAEHPIHPLLAERWSPRAFADRDVEPEAIRSLLEAARWAASSMNEQPWRFIVAPRADPERFERLLACIREGNQKWARHAPLLMLSVARSTFSRNDKPNRHAWHDVGLAVGALSAQATSMGIGLHQMGGIYPDEARRRYAIPEGFEPVAGMALGYFGDPQALPEDLRERELAPRARKPLSELAFGEWDTPSPILA